MHSRVIIFSASTGYGHNQVALALKKELEEKNIDVKIIEPFKEVSKSLDLMISDGYRVLATKMPKMYGRIYKISNNVLINKPVSIISIKALHNKIHKILEEYRPDLVISTHPLIVKTMCALKQKSIYGGPFISVITDYMPHEFYISNLVDAYIVASEYTKIGVIERGITPNKIFVYGIPIKREFLQCQNTLTKSKVFTILLMGGSMGVNSIKKAYKNLLNIPYPLKIIIVCGNNEALKKSLEEKYKKENNTKEVQILGFTNQIPQLMEIADVIITKPGGLTVTEALAKNIPMIIPYFIPGQEEENASVLLSAGAAFKVDSVKELNELVSGLVINPHELNEVKTNMKIIAKDHSLDNAVKLCSDLILYYKEMVGIKDAQ
jgi:processive 1,2-diacylglycerol beta-glucosyltransferase